MLSLVVQMTRFSIKLMLVKLGLKFFRRKLIYLISMSFNKMEPLQLHEEALELDDGPGGFSSDALKKWEKAYGLLKARNCSKKGDKELLVKVMHNLSICYDKIHKDLEKAEKFSVSAMEQSLDLGMLDGFLLINNALFSILSRRKGVVDLNRILGITSKAVIIAEDYEEATVGQRFTAWLNQAKCMGEMQWREGYQRPLTTYESFAAAQSYANSPRHHAMFFHSYGMYLLQREIALGLDPSAMGSEEAFRNYVTITNKFELPLSEFCNTHGFIDESKEWHYPPYIPEWQYD